MSGEGCSRVLVAIIVADGIRRGEGRTLIVDLPPGATGWGAINSAAQAEAGYSCEVISVNRTTAVR